MADELTEVTFSQALTGDDQRYTVHAQVEQVADQRIAVMLLAPDGPAYEGLAESVLPSVAEGPCPT